MIWFFDNKQVFFFRPCLFFSTLSPPRGDVANLSDDNLKQKKGGGGSGAMFFTRGEKRKETKKKEEEEEEEEKRKFSKKLFAFPSLSPSLSPALFRVSVERTKGAV